MVFGCGVGLFGFGVLFLCGLVAFRIGLLRCVMCSGFWFLCRIVVGSFWEPVAIFLLDLNFFV